MHTITRHMEIARFLERKKEYVSFEKEKTTSEKNENKLTTLLLIKKNSMNF